MRLISCPYCGDLHDLDRVPDVDHDLQARGKFCPRSHRPLDATAAANMPIVGRAIERDAVRASLVATAASIAAQKNDDTVMRQILSQRSDRYYAFSHIPTTSRNTFAAGRTIVLDGGGPGLFFASALANEDNKIIEFKLEAIESDVFIDGVANKAISGARRWVRTSRAIPPGSVSSTAATRATRPCRTRRRRASFSCASA
jgi:hypothetical protein